MKKITNNIIKWFKGLDKFEKILYSLLIICAWLVLSISGYIVWEVNGVSDCHKEDFHLRYIEQIENKEYATGNIEYLNLKIEGMETKHQKEIDIQTYNTFLVYGLTNGTNKTIEVIESAMLYDLQTMFPSGKDYIAIYCPVEKPTGKIEYLLRGLIDASKTNKFLFK